VCWLQDGVGGKGAPALVVVLDEMDYLVQRGTKQPVIYDLVSGAKGRAGRGGWRESADQTAHPVAPMPACQEVNPPSL
jgi:hypothetical protein